MRVAIGTQPWGVLVGSNNQLLANQTATIKNLDGTNATHWSAQTGGTSSTTSIATDQYGVLPRYIETGTYDVQVTVSGVTSTYRVEAVSGTVVSNIREAPLNILDKRFGGDNTGATTNTAALNAVDSYLGTYGGELVFPPGQYLFSTNPVITKNGVSLRGVGNPSIVCEQVAVRGDDFRAQGLNFTKRSGATEASAKAIFVDPDTAGRSLSGFTISDCTFDDFFYAVDFRGSTTNRLSRIRCENLISDRTSAGNAGHFNFFWVEDVTTMGLGSYGGQNSASQNFGNGTGAITVLGGADKNNQTSGGALNFENFFGTAKVTVVGGTWGYGISSGTDAYACTVDDVYDVTVVGADFGGYVRVQSSTDIVKRAKFSDCQMTRFRVQGPGPSSQYVEELDLIDCTIRGVPGVSATAGINLDGNFLRKCRVLGNYVKRYQADGTTENWSSAAISVARAANLDLEIDRNDFGGRPVTFSSSGGTIRFGQDNVNYGTLTGVTKAPAVSPTKAGTPADADYDFTMLSGHGPVVDTTGSKVWFRVGSTWKSATLT